MEGRVWKSLEARSVSSDSAPGGCRVEPRGLSCGRAQPAGARQPASRPPQAIASSPWPPALGLQRLALRCPGAGAGRRASWGRGVPEVAAGSPPWREGSGCLCATSRLGCLGGLRVWRPEPGPQEGRCGALTDALGFYVQWCPGAYCVLGAPAPPHPTPQGNEGDEIT